MKKKYFIFMAMLVLAIFAVGSVSAEDNVTTDIDVPVDDIVVDEVSTDDVVENGDASSDANKIVNTRYNTNVTAGSSSSTIDAAITTVNANGGGNVYFEYGNYTNICINMKSNVNLIGNGARLVGDGVNTVIKVDNCKNFTITGFVIDGNHNSDHNITIIRGSSVTNGNINNNTLYNAYSGINIFRSYANMTIENNIVRNMIYDGISLAHPNSNNNINNNGYSSISGNNVTNCTYAIFSGGNFKGEISNNNIVNSTWGIQFVGKKEGAISNIIANITGNTMVNVTTGIEFINMTVISLNINYNNITTVSNTTYTIDYGTNFSVAANGEFYMYYNRLCGAIKQSLLDLCTDYYNYCDGDVDLNN